MTPEFERHDYRLPAGSRESDTEFNAERFDELLTEDDRKLLQDGMQISWWAYSDLSMRPSPPA